jgi:hypothetical protein
MAGWPAKLAGVGVTANGLVNARPTALDVASAGAGVVYPFRHPVTVRFPLDNPAGRVNHEHTIGRTPSLAG